LLVILTQDIERFVGALQIAPRILTDGIVIIACFAYLGWLSPVLFGMLAVTLVVSLVAFNLAQRRPLRKMRTIRAKWDVLYKHFRDLVEGSRELQLNKQRGHQFVDQVLTPDAQEFKKASMQAFTSFTLISNVGDMLFYLAIGVLLFVVPLWLPQTPAVLAGVTMILLYLVGPISNMINSVPALGQAAISLQKIQQLDSKLSEEAPRIGGPNPFAGSGATLLDFQGVCHHYPGKTDDSPFLLGPIDLQVRQGEVLFIVGGNGSGKTTLAMLLLGLYLPESGTIRMNGHLLTEHNVERYREHFGAVFADFHLFEHLLGTDQAHIASMASQYIEKLSLDHKVKVVDGKFSTIDLSSGQKKRLALVNAYLEDKAVYLFDEWAADQDPTFKRVFYTELLPDLKARGKTVIVISHDDAYFDSADRIIKLEDGHVRAYVAAPVKEAPPHLHIA
jgi:putative ATP-binding cassette transporter